MVTGPLAWPPAHLDCRITEFSVLGGSPGGPQSKEGVFCDAEQEESLFSVQIQAASPGEQGAALAVGVETHVKP